MKRGISELILFLLILQVSTMTVSSEQEYHLIRTIETPHPEEHGWFGSPTAMDGDLILISSWHADVDNEAKVGKAYLYNVDGDLIASYQSPIPNTLDTFSSSIDISGDRVLIGDCSSQGDLKDVGKAYLFDTDGNLIKTFEPQSPSSHYYGPFGGSGVCFVSNRIIISEVGGETEPALAGMVHMYDDEGTFLKAIYSPSPTSGGFFGQGIEDGDELFLVNEIGDDLRALPGRVYGFDYDGNHVMTLQAPKPEIQASFGKSMDISGDKIIIGEHWATVNDIYRAGRAYLFNTDGELLRTYESPSPDVGGQFGFAVSIEGDTVVIGEPSADVNPGMAEGKAYIFDVDGTLLQNLTAPSPGRIALYGDSIKINDGVIVVGEGWAEVDGEMRAGAVHVYDWKSKGGIIVPGFPFESLLLGIGIITITLLLAQQRKSLQINP